MPIKMQMEDNWSWNNDIKYVSGSKRKGLFWSADLGIINRWTLWHLWDTLEEEELTWATH